MKPYTPEEYDFDSCLGCQEGGLLPVVFRADQRGDGFGSFFKGLFRAIMPLVRKAAVGVGKQALKSGVALAGDVAAGDDLKESAKRRLDQFGDELVHNAHGEVKAMTGGKNNKRTLDEVKLLYGSNPPKRPRLKYHKLDLGILQKTR